MDRLKNNLIPVYIDKETGELFANFGFLGNTANTLKNGFSQAGSLVGSASNKLYGNTKKTIKKAGINLARGEEGYGRQAFGKMLVKNTDNVIKGTALTGVGGISLLGTKKYLDNKQQEKNKRFFGLNR